MNVADSLGRWAEETPLGVAIIDDTRVLHFRDLDRAVWRVASRFVAEGLRPMRMHHERPADVAAVRQGHDDAAAQARFDQIADVLRVLDPEHSISFGVAEAGTDDNLQSLISRADDGLLASRASRPSGSERDATA